MIWIGYLFFALIALFAILLRVPFPIPVPRGLQNFFGSGYGEFFLFPTWLVLLTSIIGFTLWFLIHWFIMRTWNRTILKLLAVVFGVTVFLFLWILLPLSSPYEQIYLQNRDKSPNDFSNSYLRFRTIDCRDVSSEYGIIFISDGLSMEEDYLSYAPERTKKTVDYRYGRKFGDDWYLDTTGSQWDRSLFNCVNRNKAPSE